MMAEKVMSAKDQESQEYYERLGHQAFKSKNYTEAAGEFISSSVYIPIPATESELTTRLYTAAGDSYFRAKKYELAKIWLYDALICPGGIDDPLIYLRLGQTWYEIDHKDRAIEYLARAYKLGGEDIFVKYKAKKYLSFLQKKVEL